MKNKQTSDRRAAVRYPLLLGMGRVSVPEFERRWARVRDISVGGIGLILSRGFEPGWPLTIEVLTASGRPLILPARVVYSAPQNDGWLVGCRFDTDLNEDELKAIL